MSEAEANWEALNVDPSSAVFPARAIVAGAPIWVFRAAGGYRGVQDMCPHEQRSLSEALITGGEKMVRCTYHNYTFKLTDGNGVNCPGFRIAVYAIKEEGGALFAQAVSAS